MDELKDCMLKGYQSQLDRYEHEEGFSDEDKEPNVVISRNEQMYQSTNQLVLKKTRPRFHQPKAKLKYIMNQQSNRTNLHHSIVDKQLNNRHSVTKSMQIRKKQKNSNTVGMQPVIKSKRTLIGENFSLPSYATQDYKSVKQNLFAEGHTIHFEAAKQVNTHGYIKKLTTPHLKSGKNFLMSKYNALLKQKIKQSFIAPKRRLDQEKPHNGLVFNNEIQNGNLQLVVKVKESQYDLYLKIDTNTHGHQNWFHFQVTNMDNQHETFILNVCNMKRQFRLIEKGQKIFIKQNGKNDKWQPAGNNISIAQNPNQKIGNGRIYKLSFTLNLKSNTKYTIATLPAYTYSQVLNLLDQLQQKYKYLMEVDILSYSLCGLAIPVVTITNKQTKNENKKVILVSCRIHPGQSVASYVVEGLLRKLLDDSSRLISQMLKTTIFKIIPILNPDGVVFGNFRTNYLGIDLNRSFNSDDQILNPEICSLKNLGRQLKTQYPNFLYFLDLHGHSSQKNIFTYGPNFQYNDPNFYVARLLPKILSMKSKYFKYQSCSFKLEQHKLHTARAFFLNQLNIMTYTIQSSYCLYDDLDGVTKLMKIQDWIHFGAQLAYGIQIAIRIKQANTIKSNKELRNILNANEIAQQTVIIKKVKSDIKKEIKAKSKQQQNKKNQKQKQKQKEKQKNPNIQDTDGQSEAEDLNQEQRKQTEKKILQSCSPSFTLPRVLKPTILYPTVTPRLFEVNEQKDESFKLLYTKRCKYNTLRMMNANHIYANYLKNLDELQKYKPSARNIKLQKKAQT